MSNKSVGNNDVLLRSSSTILSKSVGLGKNRFSHPGGQVWQIEKETVCSVERKVGLKKSTSKTTVCLEIREPEDFVSDHEDRKSRINRAKSPLVADKIYGGRQGSSRSFDYDGQLREENERKRGIFNFFSKSSKSSSPARLRKISTSSTSSYQQKVTSPKISKEELSRSENFTSNEQVTPKATMLNKNTLTATSSKVTDESRTRLIDSLSKPSQVKAISSKVYDKSGSRCSDNSTDSNGRKNNCVDENRVTEELLIEAQDTDLNEMKCEGGDTIKLGKRYEGQNKIMSNKEQMNVEQETDDEKGGLLESLQEQFSCGCRAAKVDDIDTTEKSAYSPEKEEKEIVKSDMYCVDENNVTEDLITETQNIETNCQEEGVSKMKGEDEDLGQNDNINDKEQMNVEETDEEKGLLESLQEQFSCGCVAKVDDIDTPEKSAYSDKNELNTIKCDRENTLEKENQIPRNVNVSDYDIINDDTNDVSIKSECTKNNLNTVSSDSITKGNLPLILSVSSTDSSKKKNESKPKYMSLDISPLNSKENPPIDPMSESPDSNQNNSISYDGNDISINNIVRVDTSKSKEDLQYPGAGLVDSILTRMNSVYGIIQNAFESNDNTQPNDSIHSLSQVYRDGTLGEMNVFRSKSYEGDYSYKTSCQLRSTSPLKQNMAPTTNSIHQSSSKESNSFKTSSQRRSTSPLKQEKAPTTNINQCLSDESNTSKTSKSKSTKLFSSSLKQDKAPTTNIDKCLSDESNTSKTSKSKSTTLFSRFKRKKKSDEIVVVEDENKENRNGLNPLERAVDQLNDSTLFLGEKVAYYLFGYVDEETK